MDINCLTYSVKGLNSLTKRHKVLRELQQYGADVVFMQETHLLWDSGIKLYSRNFSNWIYSDSPIKRAKGVAIGFSKRLNYVLIDRKSDPEGRFLFLKIKLGERILTLANVYCPNRGPTKYLSQILNRLIEFREGEVILAGEFNFCLDSALHSLSSARGMSKNLLMRVGQKLHDCQLIDVWRVQHAKVRDYTFFSPVHGIYSRLDYLMVDHSLLESVVETKIEIRTLSDHAPVLMKVRVKRLQKPPYTWRLNENLIRDVEIARKIQQEIDSFFLINDTGEISEAALWEAFKAYIRGF